MGLAGDRPGGGRDDRRPGGDDAGPFDPASARHRPAQRRRHRDQRQVDDDPDDRGRAVDLWARLPPTPRAPTWTPGWWPRSPLHRDAALAVLEVDEMHVPHVADAIEPAVIVLLNLSRDQLDRVGEINVIERRLRAGLAAAPGRGRGRQLR